VAGDPGENVSQPGLRINAIHFAGLCRAPKYAEQMFAGQAGRGVQSKPLGIFRCRQSALRKSNQIFADSGIPLVRQLQRGLVLARIMHGRLADVA
jgi:hypothetical protein